jgi:Adenylate cyclase associated (CAP) C terminal
LFLCHARQVLVKVPTVSIDKTDGCMVYLSQESVSAQIVTAKSSEMNILVPDGTGEFVSSIVASIIAAYFAYFVDQRCQNKLYLLH